MPSFPINAIKSQFLAALNENNTILLTAPTGSGKSTVLPLWLIKEAAIEGKIYLLQPRRIAAKNIAIYLSQQLGEKVGNTVGYRLRDEAKVSSLTKLEVITQGVLVRLLQDDPELLDTSVILFDEFHERSCQGDLAFALARDCQQGLREDLVLVLMSATLNNQIMLSQLADAAVLSSEGRSFPVAIEYHPVAAQQPWLNKIISEIRLAAKQFTQSILAFLPGKSDIDYCAEQLVDLHTNELQVCVLHGQLSLAEQTNITQHQAGIRKIILATNIAETSLTIDGIGVVIDSGLEKRVQYHPGKLSNQLVLQQISQASAVQRAGRAGRTQAGICIRLYSQEQFQRMPIDAPVEILRADLLPIALEAALWGVTDLAQLPFFELPSQALQTFAWQQLQQVNIVDQHCKITEHGKKVAKLAVHPRLGNMLVAATQLSKQLNDELVWLACLIAAIVEQKELLPYEQAKQDASLISRIEFLQKNNNHLCRQSYKQAQRLWQKLSNQPIPKNQLPLQYSGLLLLLAFPERLAKKRKSGSGYLLTDGQGCVLTENDPLNRESLLVVGELFQQQKRNQANLVAKVEFEQIRQFFPYLIKEHQYVYYDQQTEQIRVKDEVMLGKISMQSKLSSQSLTSEQIQQIWHTQITKNGLNWLIQQAAALKLLQRWRFVNQTHHDLLPDASEASLLAELDIWLLPFLTQQTSLAQLQQLNFTQLLLNRLDYTQQQLLNEAAPKYYQAATGSKYAIDYDLAHNSAKVSLPMQAMYGVQQTPTIGIKEYTMPLLLEFLSPAGRPIQVTANLEGFWQGSYQLVQKDMKAKYPKHVWPDDPANAKPTSRVKRFYQGNID